MPFIRQTVKEFWCHTIYNYQERDIFSLKQATETVSYNITYLKSLE